MNLIPSSVDAATLALIDHNIQKSFKAGYVNDDNTYKPLDLDLGSAMALLDRHFKLDKKAYSTIRKFIKDAIAKGGIKTSSSLYKLADAEFKNRLGRVPRLYVAPPLPKRDPVKSAQESVRTLQETETKLRTQLSKLSQGTPEYNSVHEKLANIVKKLKDAEDPLGAYYQNYSFGSQDEQGTQPKNESDDARRQRLEGIYPRLKKRVEDEQVNFFNLIGLIANAYERIGRLHHLYYDEHNRDTALIKENNNLIDRLAMLLKNFDRARKEMQSHVDRLSQVSTGLNEYVIDENARRQVGLDFGVRTALDVYHLFSDNKGNAPGQFGYRLGNLIGDVTQIPDLVASLPKLKIREFSNALSVGMTGEPISAEVYRQPWIQATQQIGEMGAYLLPGFGEVLTIASLINLKRSMERDPVGTFSEIYNSFDPTANTVRDPETGVLRDAVPADRFVRGLNLLMLVVGTSHMNGGFSMDGLAKSMSQELHVSITKSREFVQNLNTQLLKRGIEVEAKLQLKDIAKENGFKTVDEYIKANPDALEKRIAGIENSPNQVKRLSLPEQIEQLGKQPGVTERIQGVRSGSIDEGGKGGGGSNKTGTGPKGGQKVTSGSDSWINSSKNDGGLGGSGGPARSGVSPTTPPSPIAQGPKTGGGVAVMEPAASTSTKVQSQSGQTSRQSSGQATALNEWTVDGSSSNPKTQGLKEGYKWSEENPIDNPSIFDLPQPNGQPSGIKLELGPDGHLFTLSDGSSFMLKKPHWQRVLEENYRSYFGSSATNAMVGDARFGFKHIGEPQSFPFGNPSEFSRFSDLGDPTKSGAGSERPAAAGGTNVGGQTGTGVQSQADSGGVAVAEAGEATKPQTVTVGGTRLKIEAVPTYPYVKFTTITGPHELAVTPKIGLDDKTAVQLIGGNQGGAGQSGAMGVPEKNPTTPPPTDPTNPTNPAKPGVQGINEMQPAKGYIFDISHPGWRERTLTRIQQTQQMIDGGQYKGWLSDVMNQYVEMLKRSLDTGTPIDGVLDEFPHSEVENNINEYRKKMGFELLPKGWWDVQNEVIKELQAKVKDPNPAISEAAKKDLEEVMDHRDRWKLDHLTEQRIFQNQYKEAPQDAGLFDDPESGLPISKDPVFKYAVKPGDGSLYVSFRPESFEAVDADLKNIDQWKIKFRDPIRDWDEAMAYLFQPYEKVFGNKVIPAGSHSYIPLAPEKLQKYINDPSALRHTLTLVSADMRDAATKGLMHAQMIRGLYNQGKITTGETGEYIAWAMLSKRLTPFYQEAGFMILLENGLKNWIQGAAQGKFNEGSLKEYYAWVYKTLKGSQSGASAINNAKAFGRDFLLKGSQVLKEGLFAGKTAIQAIHEIIANPNLSGRQMRRMIAEINFPLRLGFDNKITSFILQMTGKTDVMVLDRVQFNHFWNSFELAPKLGIKTQNGSSTANLYDNTNLAMIANGPRGIAVYEAMEEALSKPVLDAYRRLGITDGNLSRFHWETWSLHSSQATDHSTLNLITNNLLGLSNNGIGAKQGKFNTWGSQSIFGYGTGGKFGTYTWKLSDGTSKELTSEQHQRLLEELKRQQAGRGQSQYTVIPKGFKLTNFDENGAKIPWFQAKSVNRQNLDLLIRSIAK